LELPVNDRRTHLLALCALPGVTGKQWQVIARQAERPGGLEDLLDGVVNESHRAAASLRENLRSGLGSLGEAESTVLSYREAASEAGASLTTVLDDDYPQLLRGCRERPPFLFWSGDGRAWEGTTVAVVGTRKVSAEGRSRARRLTEALCAAGSTIVSGMAEGVDTVAHETALVAGSPTIAVLGTGILLTFPAKNAALKERISSGGAVVSQFWPAQPPGRHTFPMRNVIISGLSAMTVVVEASETSGARLQARITAEQGRTVVLLTSLVEAQPWAAKMVDNGLAHAAATPAEAVALLTPASAATAPAPEAVQERLGL
jgi:DNA processing protein